jgi:hypothetical protein
MEDHRQVANQFDTFVVEAATIISVASQRNQAVVEQFINGG